MKNDLELLAEENLVDSGLTYKQVAALGWKVLTAVETKKLGFDALPSLYIPYLDPHSKKPLKCLPHLPALFQVRYLKDAPGFASLCKNKRYHQNPNSGVGGYWTPSVDWEPVVKDPSAPILITEGAKKAAKACLEGFFCIALGGVDSIGSKKHGLDLSPDMARINWQDRSVYLCFDSDIVYKKEVQDALRRLADTLTLKGAVCHAVYLPDTGGGGKTALDSFLREKGRQALVDCLEEARALGAITSQRSRALMDLNDKVIYIEHPSHIIALKGGDTISVKSFRGENYADHMHQDEKRDKDTGEMAPTGKLRSSADDWIKWRGKFRAYKRTYAPGAEHLIEGRYGMTYNSWPGLAVAPKNGDVTPWLTYVAWLANGDKTLARHIHNWLGYPLKHPGTKLYTSLAMWSVDQGTGKTLLGECMSDIYGADTNYSTVTEDELASPYNSYIVGKQFILADECTGNDHRAYSNKLKRTVTQTTVRVSEKYVPSYSVPDYANWLFTSNQPDALFLEDGDRRFIIVEITGGRMPREIFEPLSLKKNMGAWRKGGGMAHVLHYYMHRHDYTGFDSTDAAPMTAAKLDMLESGRSAHGAWVAELKRNPDRVLRIGEARIQKDWLTVAELLSLYEKQHGGAGRLSNVGLGRELKKQGLVSTPNLRISGNVHRWVLVNRLDLWLNNNGRVDFTPAVIEKVRKNIELDAMPKNAPKKY